MNRDELLSRQAALPPSMHRRGELAALYPHELMGGTWVGINESGLTLALINWYSQPQLAGSVSRGEVIPALLAAETAGEAEVRLKALRLSRANPFRLIIVSPGEKRLQEWSSSGRLLEGSALPWEKHHWFSSGFDEEKANHVRRLTCYDAAGQSDSDTLPWLRRLHRSHRPTKGAFSLCMHRADACTVSSTEISVNHTSAVMTYHAGLPCCDDPPFTMSLRLSARLSSGAL